ncbi:hypothetical protein [Streptomyces sp. NPDC051636]|uniref:hypothetical protein n=1 Tax=Streptomyces sp. NPDC051636 TaxID=3365663 RepID=UPI0037942B4F
MNSSIWRRATRVMRVYPHTTCSRPGEVILRPSRRAHLVRKAKCAGSTTSRSGS